MQHHISRRRFLQQSGLLSASLFVPQFLQADSGNTTFSGKRVIIIQLAGGNDGLNTVVPYQNDLYHKARPGIGLSGSKVIALNDELAWNQKMEPIRDIYEGGYLTIINNVGYPNPNRSHFRSMDIWQSASDSDDYLSTGWVGRYLDNYCSGQPHEAIALDESLPLALKGKQHKGLAFTDPNQLVKQSQIPMTQQWADTPATHHTEASYLRSVRSSTLQSAAYLEEKLGGFQWVTGFPMTDFGKQLQQVAQLITAGVEAQFYYVSLSGFDTHAGQNLLHGRLLHQYAKGMDALYRYLKDKGEWKNTMVLTFSEFGRRVKENASGGTDHGAANPVWLAGGGIKNPGILNDGPDLDNLVEGDVAYSVDFRQVYATLLEDWLGRKSNGILQGKFGTLKV